MVEITRNKIKSKTLEFMVKALENNQSIPVSNSVYIIGVGELAKKTLVKEGNEYFIYQLANQHSAQYVRRKIPKDAAMKILEGYVSNFDKEELEQELEYWEECESFLNEHVENNFVESIFAEYVSER